MGCSIGEGVEGGVFVWGLGCVEGGIRGMWVCGRVSVGVGMCRMRCKNGMWVCGGESMREGGRKFIRVIAPAVLEPKLRPSSPGSATATERDRNPLQERRISQRQILVSTT